MARTKPMRRPWTPTPAIAEAMTSRIVAQFKPLRVVLFGSLARGDEGPDSDVDLLVVLDEAHDRRRAMVEILCALSDFPASKDVVVTTPEEIARRGTIDGSVLRLALSEGRVLYERE